MSWIQGIERNSLSKSTHWSTNGVLSETVQHGVCWEVDVGVVGIVEGDAADDEGVLNEIAGLIELVEGTIDDGVADLVEGSGVGHRGGVETVMVSFDALGRGGQ